jgi:hypothetical protein
MQLKYTINFGHIDSEDKTFFADIVKMHSVLVHQDTFLLPKIIYANLTSTSNDRK